MNPQIRKLYDIARKKERIILGTMSGTSLDGLDIAVCKFTGSGKETKYKLLHFASIPFASSFKKEILTVFSKREIDLQQLTLLHPFIATVHAEIILNCLAEWNIKPAEINIIASHGQTMYHAPQRLHKKKFFLNATLQLGDGDHLAVTTGIITLSDFRQKHLAAGGEGAPLAIYFDYFFAQSEEVNRILLNIGGISNASFLPKKIKIEKDIVCSDLGPGNTIMDAFVRKNYKGKQYDEGGKIAAKGAINEKLLLALKSHPFLQEALPKTCGPEIFNLELLDACLLKSEEKNYSKEDILATLNAFTASCIADGVSQMTKNKPASVYVSGGGSLNPVLMENIQQYLPKYKVQSSEAIGINSDAKEAVLFALLANEMLTADYKNSKIKLPLLPVQMGKISFP